MDKSLLGSLAVIVGEENVRSLEPLASHTTFKIRGPADAFVSPRSVEEVSQVVCACEQSSVPWRVIGCGSDLLVADEGVEGVVIEVRDNLSAIPCGRHAIVAGAGATNAAVAEAACSAGLSGYEFACIPGTVGGAAIMNAGAYDGEFSQVCACVTCVTPEGRIVEVPPRGGRVVVPPQHVRRCALRRGRSDARACAGRFCWHQSAHGRAYRQARGEAADRHAFCGKHFQAPGGPLSGSADRQAGA